MTPIPSTELDALIEAEKKATKGPWYDDGCRVYGPIDADEKRNGAMLFEYKHVDDANWDDYPFIASLRNAAPSLLAEVKRLREVERAVKEWRGVPFAFHRSCDCQLCAALSASLNEKGQE